MPVKPKKHICGCVWFFKAVPELKEKVQQDVAQKAHTF